MFCRKCGARLGEGDKFCSSCGTAAAVDGPEPGTEDAHEAKVRNGDSGFRVRISKPWYKKLWDGDYSLAKSYWGFTVLASLLAVAAVRFFSFIAGDGLAPFLFLVYFAAVFVYSPVAMVGVWRSSKRYAGARIWAILARLCVAIGVLNYVNALFTAFKIFGAMV